MSTYEELKRAADERRLKASLERDKSWWRSLSASEREAGFCTWKHRVFDAVFIKIPLPWTGEIDVIRVGLAGRFSRRVAVNIKQREKLRAVVAAGGRGKWIVKRAADAITLFYGNKVKTRSVA